MIAEAPLGRLASISYGLGQPPPLASTGVPIIRATNIERGRILSAGLIFAKLEDLPLDRAPLLAIGEILVVRSGAYTGDSALVTEAWKGAAPGYDLRVTPRHGSDSRFLAYSLLGRRALDSMRLASSRAAQAHLNAEELAAVPITKHDLAEQRAIADFLDFETARIDKAAALKGRMIELIREREAAAAEASLLSTTRTLLPLRRLLSRPPAYGAGESGVEGEPGWPRYIRITDIADDGLRAEGVVRLAPDVAKPHLLQDGDLLLARSGATVGKSFAYRSEVGAAAFAGYLIQFRPDPKKVLPGLLAAWTSTSQYWSQVRLASLQATIENVSAESYKGFLVPVPPPDEQSSILRTIDGEHRRCRALGGALIAQIALLQEHRQALITAAVTGQLDVAQEIAEEAS